MKVKLSFFIIFTLYFATLKSQNIDFIEKIQNYKETVKLVHTDSSYYNDYIDTSTFNIKTYMEMYPALKSKKKNYVFDYYRITLHGKPYIYVKKKKFNLIDHFNKMADERNLNGSERIEYIGRSIKYFLFDPLNEAYKNIVPEDTKEGYLQYLYFYELGELFALEWQSFFKKKHVIATKKEIDDIIKQCTEKLNIVDTINDVKGKIRREIFDCNAAALQEFVLSDSIILVQLTEEYVIIKWLEFEDWRGVFERTYKIMRKPPYCIELIDEKRLVEIQNTFINNFSEE